MVSPTQYGIRMLRRLNAASRWQAGGLALCAVLALAACTGEAKHAPGRPSRTDAQAVESATNENIVPIARPLPLKAMERPLVVDFELPALGPNATRTLFLGIRVTAENSQQSALISDRVIAAGLQAEVNLVRVLDSATQAMPLVRVETSEQGPTVLAPIGPGGRVLGVRRDDVDDTLIDPEDITSAVGHSRYLSFALAQNVAPGRYRVSVRIGKTPVELSSVNSELLVAYRHRSK